MTPYVINEDESDTSVTQKPKTDTSVTQKSKLDTTVTQKPKSIMVNDTLTGGLSNGTVHTNGDLVETPDSIPSRSSVSGKSIIGNGRNGKSGALKRVSFGSSKGSMVETLVYDHLEDLNDHQPIPPFATPPLLNGEDSRLTLPAKVRVQFFESQPVAQVATPPSPDVTLDFSSPDIMTSPDHAQYDRQISAESGVDNPFRPDGELSREADTIVSLIKEGKPITPIKGEESVVEIDEAVVANGFRQTDSLGSSLVAKENDVSKVSATTVEAVKAGANGSAPKENASAPGVVEVKHSVIAPPTDAPQVEQVVIKKKPKCKCCVIQ